MSLSTNMSMPIPTVGETAGPTWASNINSCLTIVDSHNHAPGSGVQINPDGININDDLTFANNNGTNFRSVRFYTQAAVLSAPTDLGCAYVTGVDLYFNDGSGNQVRITQSGGVAGSPGSIGSLTAPASANYVAGSKKFTWQSGASKAAAMDSGALLVRETDVASANAVTIQSPTSLAGNYSLTLPTALPGSTQYVSLSAAGALATATADTIAAGITATGANAIGSTMTSTGANAVAASRTRATGTSVAAGGVAISTTSGLFTSSSSSYTDITNLTVTITTSGRPVFIILMPDGNLTDGHDADIFVRDTGASSAEARFKILRDGVGKSIHDLQIAGGGDSSCFIGVAPGFISFIDTPGAGTYVYKLQGKLSTGTSFGVVYTMLAAYEL